ncbi:MAG: UvrD-helicase domain-containing protein [Armatimonadetes bacterium]|nr:UvrD-helicase domain-containing protein [Armatimonadota bacterium]
MNDRILEDLNEQQQAAVLHTEGPVLVFAGAGSGKTRVLTYRIAYLIKEKGVRPYNILAVTFTNKAANEMKERITELLGEQTSGLWAGTFHGTCARMLRERGHEIGIDRNFTIFDESDQISLVRESMEQLRLDQKRFHPRAILDLISRAKERLVEPHEFGRHFNGEAEAIANKVYPVYQQKLRENRALDFDDLVMFGVKLLKEGKANTEPPRREHCSAVSAQEHYQERFRYILVDEYQDINYAQYMLVRILGAKHRNIFCVGDDDQSIYRWRGADVNIILQFESDYPDATVYKLERNYRSTKKILEAAHHVVAQNRGRAQKKLWTENEEGCNIQIIEAGNEIDEAERIVTSIREKVRSGRRYRDIAVLYRINAQSRVLEETFVRQRIPHRLVGAMRFYERKEIKDAIAYLRLAANPLESVSLRRVINVPPRGIGATSLTRLEEFATSRGISLYEALHKLDEAPDISKRAKEAMSKFAAIIDHLHELSSQVSVPQLTNEALSVSGYYDALREEHTAEAESRMENIRELLTVTEQFEQTSEDRSLGAFLENVALISDIDTYDPSGDAATLMTLHSAKGLEFPVVYIAGMEEGLLPHRRSHNDRDEMEEERRLCYVGMTRAKEELVFSHAYKRSLMGSTQLNEVSRFLRDIPTDLFEQGFSERRRAVDTTWKRDFTPRRTPNTATFRPATRVEHDFFGRGIVLNSTGSGEDELVTVAFESGAVKTLAVSKANLKRL